MNRAGPIKVALFLCNMGGPENLENVQPFLRELFQDNDLLAMPFPSLTQNFIAEKIVSKRTADIQKKYSGISGGSPQLATTRAVCEKMIIAVLVLRDLSIPFQAISCTL